MAVALRVLDVTAEVLAELPYMAFAGWVLWRWRHGGGQNGGVLGARSFTVDAAALWHWGAALALIAVLAVAWLRLGRRLGRRHGHLPKRWRETRSGRRFRAEVHLLRRELRRQRIGMPAAIALHIVGWGLSGVQVWIAAWIFGVPLALWQALAIESAATSARVILFFVPGGIGMQEAGAVLAGAALGVPAPAALAFSLVLRLRDVAFGMALLAWPALEWRRRGV